MTTAYRLQELHVADEGSLAENAESPSSLTYSSRLPFISATATLDADRIRNPGMRSRMNEEGLSNIGPRSGGLEFTSYFPGHDTAPSGALTPTWLHDLLSDGLGGGDVAGVGTTISGTASTATSLNVVSATATVGGIVRVGVKGDGKGDGQAAVVASAGAGVIGLLTALPAAPTTAGHVVYATQSAYHDESVSGSLVTKRFMFGHATTGAQFHVLGAQLSGLSMNFPLTNELPTITLRYLAAYWQRQAVTIPSSSPSLASCNAAPVAGGSMFINDVGTATRATIQPASVQLDIDLGLAPVIGPGGAGTYQQIVGWRRTMCKPTLTVSIPWVTTYETWWDTANDSIAYKHLLFTANAVAGRAIGFYLPRMQPVGPRPSRVTDQNGLNYVQVQFVGVDSTVTTSEQTKSACRIWMG